MRSPRTDQRGIALVMVMLITVAVSALVAGAILLTGSTGQIARGQEREEEMRNAADAGIELGRSALNGGAATMPDSLYTTFQSNQTVTDANGVVVPGVTRSIYFGPTGSSTGQYGIFGSVVSVITDRSGAVVVRRGELSQESFAKFAYYSDDEGSGICFGGGDNIFGPLHTNDDMCIYSSLARFHSTVEISGTLSGAGYGTFDVGYTEHGSIIPMPTIAQLAKLNTYATAGGMSFTAPDGSTEANPRMRIEFVTVDLDGDGRTTAPNEGFYRVYEETTSVANANLAYLSASRIARPDTSRNCGHFHNSVFFTANMHQNNTPNNIWLVPWITAPSRAHAGAASASTTAGNESLSLNNSGGAYRCWLGGDEHLNVTSYPAGILGVPTNTFVPGDRYGRWKLYSATPDPAIIAGLANAASGVSDVSLANRTTYASYLWPLSRTFNPNSKGVIYVNGRVGISGVINGRVTLAATGDITVLDDLRYAIAPGSVPCLAANILGLLSPDSLYMSDNTLNAPWDYASGNALDPAGTARNYDDSNDETIQGVLLTLKSFGVQNYANGSTTAQPCGTTAWGRGCLYLTGGLIQQTRGGVGLGSGQGYLKRYSYDICAFQTPPPYFPTTGRYDRNRYYEIDPVGFNVSSFFAALAPN